MKKLVLCAASLAGVAGIVAYMNKNGLPVLGNLTMKLPVKTGIDAYDILFKGIQMAESAGISL